jgi:hypothetical protein
VSKHHRLVAELCGQLDDIVSLRRDSPNQLFIDATDGGTAVLDLDAIAKAVEMPSKKKLRKRYRKLEDRYENLYSKFQDAGREAWEVSRARDNAVKELRELQTAARELVHALDDGRQDDIPQRKDAVRDLLPGEPWTLRRVERARARIQELADTAAKAGMTGGQVTSIADMPDWAKTIHNSMSPLARAFTEAINQPIDRDIIERDGHVHNHGSEDGPGLACRETRQPDGRLRGECMKDAA